MLEHSSYAMTSSRQQASVYQDEPLNLTIENLKRSVLKMDNLKGPKSLTLALNNLKSTTSASAANKSKYSAVSITNNASTSIMSNLKRSNSVGSAKSSSSTAVEDDTERSATVFDGFAAVKSRSPDRQRWSSTMSPPNDDTSSPTNVPHVVVEQSDVTAQQQTTADFPLAPPPPPPVRNGRTKRATSATRSAERMPELEERSKENRISVATPSPDGSLELANTNTNTNNAMYQHGAMTMNQLLAFSFCNGLPAPSAAAAAATAAMLYNNYQTSGVGLVPTNASFPYISASSMFTAATAAGLVTGIHQISSSAATMPFPIPSPYPALYTQHMLQMVQWQHDQFQSAAAAAIAAAQYYQRQQQADETAACNAAVGGDVAERITTYCNDTAPLAITAASTPTDNSATVHVSASSPSSSSASASAFASASASTSYSDFSSDTDSLNGAQVPDAAGVLNSRKRSYSLAHRSQTLDHHKNSNDNGKDSCHATNNNQDKKKPHIKKPLNAFMLYMKEMRAKVVAECTLKESAAINQILGRRWHSLSREEQAKYYEKARQERQLHMELYPGWSARDNYGYGAKKKKRKKERVAIVDSAAGTANNVGAVAGGNSMKKCRARYGLDQQSQWCKPCRRKKRCIRYVENGGDSGNQSDDNAGSGTSTVDGKSAEDDDAESFQHSLSSPGALSVLSSLTSPSMILPSPNASLASPSVSLASPCMSMQSPLTPHGLDYDCPQANTSKSSIPPSCLPLLMHPLAGPIQPSKNPVGTNPHDINNPLSVNQLTGKCVKTNSSSSSSSSSSISSSGSSSNNSAATAASPAAATNKNSRPIIRVT